MLTTENTSSTTSEQKATRLPLRLLVAVGSRRDRVCSVGAFARAEALAYEPFFNGVEILEPDEQDNYPLCKNIARPDVILFHAPALHDRKRPWNALLSAAILRRAFPKAKFISIVHEFSEAPLHWKARQVMLAKFSHGVVANTESDFKSVLPWQKNILRSRLGPTLFMPELLELGVQGLQKRREEFRLAVAQKLKIDSHQKWVLHSGLVTPGKGVNFLEKLVPHLDPQTRLLVMGGFGPKQRDRDFAQVVLKDLEQKLPGRFTFIDSPDDQTFKKVLFSVDLVALPYDVGVSERRSSFLSAVSCGANVWTTTGEFSKPMGLQESGAHTVTSESWNKNDPSAFASLVAALQEGKDYQFVRRIQNLRWAQRYSWSHRAQALQGFIRAFK